MPRSSGSLIRFYADVNVVHALRTTWTPREFDCRAAQGGIVLAVGLHVIYELARGFVSGRHKDDVQAASAFLAEIRRVEFLPKLQTMIAAEFDEAMYGVPVVTVLSLLNQCATRFELARLGCGHADRAVTFIARREAAIEVDHPRIARANRARLRALPRISTFAAFRTRMLRTGVDSLMDLAALQQLRVRRAALKRVLARPADFPVLTTWLNAQWYCAWIAAHHRVPPARDKLDDFRHLLESARCDGFVTRESSLRTVGATISPSRPCLDWDDLRARLL